MDGGEIPQGVGRIYSPEARPPSLPTDGICEQFHKTMRDECYNLLFRKKMYQFLEELQVDWMSGSGNMKYNEERPHSGYCYGKTPWQTFLDSRQLALEKDLSRGGDRSDT
jgi:hypothetical protein